MAYCDAHKVAYASYEGACWKCMNEAEEIRRRLNATLEKGAGITVDTKGKTKSNGGPSSYYDFPHGAVTWNDVAEIKAQSQWGAFSYHMKDIGKAIMRFGAKDGTTNAYDARKIIYSGLRLLGMIEGKDAMRKELLDLLDDPQFKA